MSEPMLSLMNEDVNPAKSRLLMQWLRAGSVLDVGCGNGLYGFDLEKRCAEILQVDIVDRRAEAARRFPFQAMDAAQLELEPSSYANVVAFDIAEHLDDDQAFFRAVHEILEPQGRFILSVPNSDNSQLERLNLAHVHFTDKTHKREYSPESLREALESTDFKVLRIDPHVNRAIVSFAKLLATPSAMSRFLAAMLSKQVRILEKLGLFRNEVVADWFAVAEKKTST